MAKMSDKMHELLAYGEFSVTMWAGRAASKVPCGASLKTVSALVERGLLYSYRKPGEFTHWYSPVSVERAKRAALSEYR